MALHKSNVKNTESTKELILKNDTRVAFDSPVSEIHSLHEEIRRAMIDAGNVFIRNAIQIGKLLSEIKMNLPHGEFKSWVDSNVKFSMRMVQRYMKIYQNREAIESQGFQSIRQALDFLSKPSSDEIEESSISDKDLKAKFKKAFESKNLEVLTSKEKTKLSSFFAEREETLEKRIEKLKESLKDLKKKQSFLGKSK